MEVEYTMPDFSNKLLLKDEWVTLYKGCVLLNVFKLSVSLWS